MTSQLIKEDQLLSQTEGILVSDMDGEKVMMSIHSGKYYNLGSTGGRIWEIIAVPATIEHIVSVLSSEYEIEKSVCEQQVSAYLKLLLQEGLIQAGMGI